MEIYRKKLVHVLLLVYLKCISDPNKAWIAAPVICCLVVCGIDYCRIMVHTQEENGVCIHSYIFT